MFILKQQISRANFEQPAVLLPVYRLPAVVTNEVNNDNDNDNNNDAQELE